jgi:DNA polymerase I-like protein with 3'-5' exonuclease and polymerase domains
MWKRGYILISELTGHKRFLNNYEELLKIRNNKNSAFWEEYRRLKNKNPNDEEIIKIKEGFKKIADYERDALNTPVQGTAALITKVAAIKYFNHLLEKNLLFKVLIINIVHDEILLEIPIQIAEKEAKNLQKAMEDAGKIFVKIVTLKAEPLLSNHWIH